MPFCVTLYRSAVAATLLWILSVGLMMVATIIAIIQRALSAPAAIMLGWSIIAAAAAAVMSVKYLIDKGVSTALDEGALLLDARDGSPPPPHRGTGEARHLSAAD